MSVITPDMKFITPEWNAPSHIKALTTLRSGWGEKHSQQNDASKGNLKNLYNLPQEPIWLKQIHSTTVIEAKPENTNTEADASYTIEKNRVCIVLTADCLPILICNQKGTLVAAIHAGWRGLAAGIIDTTLKTIAEPPENLLVWFGPAIGFMKYEVGLDVYKAFMAKNPGFDGGFRRLSENKWLADLYTLAKLYFHSNGVKKIFGGGFCTYSQSQLFYSYRRDKEHTGRMATMIWISDKT